MRHHELYEHINNYNTRLVKINLYFLFSIMLLPITISFMFTANEPGQLQLLLFFFNLTLCNLMFYLMLVVIFHKKNNFSTLTNKATIRKMKFLSFALNFVFLAVIVLVLLNVTWFYAPFIAFFFVQRFYKRRERKALQKGSLHTENI